MSNETEIVDLRGRVIRLEAQIEYIYRHFGITFVDDQSLTDDSEVIEQLQKGNLIGAIAAYRRKYNTGLAEAKTAVENMKARLNI